MTENPEPVLRADGTEATPSEVIGPDTLDQALLVIVIRADSTAVTFVGSNANRPAVSGWLHEVADLLTQTQVTCEACREGHDHTHVQA